ncbi:hypothetical protein FVW20_03940 [Desulfovibrio oxamicus]|uniref:DUF2231 domain-containing protein n=2 Tax=Nitratidesulfovibrio TaxID=2802295 RepID=B8DJS8_NITV9|nr:hypothetical protein [Nitratidesulfovibrio oxamicus]MBG3876201.1 hypothetical protein [Nitratidesulfovibrio oxamicus]
MGISIHTGWHFLGNGILDLHDTLNFFMFWGFILLFLAAAFIGGAASRKIAEYMPPQYMKDGERSLHLDLYALDPWIPLPVQRNYILSHFLMGLAGLCLVIAYVRKGDWGPAAVFFAVGAAGIWGGMTETMTYRRNKRLHEQKEAQSED